MADVNLSTTESLKVGLTDTPSALAKATSTTLVEYLIAGETIFPSGYDIAGTPGDGITMRERSLSDNWIGLQSANNFTFSGMVVPASSLTLSLTMPSGVAYLAGRYVSVPATVLTFSPSTTSYVFLKVTRDVAGNVTGAWYEVNTTSTPPTDATPIATVTTGVGAITSTTDVRLIGPHGAIQITSGAAWIVPAGIARFYVKVIGASGGGGGGSGAGVGATNGSDGTAGGTTTFDTLTANGGGAGQGGILNGSGQSGASHGGASGGQVNLTGGGRPGGIAGNAGQSAAGGSDGTTGGHGGYSAGVFISTPGTSITISIGAAGSAGGGGAGTTTGAAGRAGLAGVIVVDY